MIFEHFVVQKETARVLYVLRDAVLQDHLVEYLCLELDNPFVQRKHCVRSGVKHGWTLGNGLDHALVHVPMVSQGLNVTAIQVRTK